ncbi:hypothetical protein RFI_01698 [Reticulomyxa filosa]|uniref:Uncharacterized protein n=1 Tax=Reticulomyxa filosa TaxID=46433 RepID=X6PCK7_RETFI|nr:hypothetical protein RFI_01698 [Reticulomyxa filosa]|eukprot:ETO35367.1 hypothetical protein RFI_01698 [Reticulomyxa filosa]
MLTEQMKRHKRACVIQVVSTSVSAISWILVCASSDWDWTYYALLLWEWNLLLSNYLFFFSLFESEFRCCPCVPPLHACFDTRRLRTPFLFVRSNAALQSLSPNASRTACLNRNDTCDDNDIHHVLYFLFPNQWRVDVDVMSKLVHFNPSIEDVHTYPAYSERQSEQTTQVETKGEDVESKAKDDVNTNWNEQAHAQMERQEQEQEQEQKQEQEQGQEQKQESEPEQEQEEKNEKNEKNEKIEVQIKEETTSPTIKAEETDKKEEDDESSNQMMKELKSVIIDTSQIGNEEMTSTTPFDTTRTGGREQEVEPDTMTEMEPTDQGIEIELEIERGRESDLNEQEINSNDMDKKENENDDNNNEDEDEEEEEEEDNEMHNQMTLADEEEEETKTVTSDITRKQEKEISITDTSMRLNEIDARPSAMNESLLEQTQVDDMGAMMMMHNWSTGHSPPPSRPITRAPTITASVISDTSSPRPSGIDESFGVGTHAYAHAAYARAQTLSKRKKRQSQPVAMTAAMSNSMMGMNAGSKRQYQRRQRERPLNSGGSRDSASTFSDHCQQSSSATAKQAGSIITAAPNPLCEQYPPRTMQTSLTATATATGTDTGTGTGTDTIMSTGTVIVTAAQSTMADVSPFHGPTDPHGTHWNYGMVGNYDDMLKMQELQAHQVVARSIPIQFAAAREDEDEDEDNALIHDIPFFANAMSAPVSCFDLFRLPITNNALSNTSLEDKESSRLINELSNSPKMNNLNTRSEELMDGTMYTLDEYSTKTQSTEHEHKHPSHASFKRKSVQFVHAVPGMLPEFVPRKLYTTRSYHSISRPSTTPHVDLKRFNHSSISALSNRIKMQANAPLPKVIDQYSNSQRTEHSSLLSDNDLFQVIPFFFFFFFFGAILTHLNYVSFLCVAQNVNVCITKCKIHEVEDVLEEDNTQVAKRSSNEHYE